MSAAFSSQAEAQAWVHFACAGLHRAHATSDDGQKLTDAVMFADRLLVEFRERNLELVTAPPKAPEAPKTPKTPEAPK